MGVARPICRAVSTVGVLSLVAALVAAISGCQTAYQGPIIDAHGHLGGSFDTKTILAVMEANDIPRQTIMARYYHTGDDDGAGTDEQAMELVAAHPGKFYPLVGMQRPMLSGESQWRELSGSVEWLLEATERKLKTGRFYGIGELILRHWAYTKGRHAEIENPVYSLLMKRFSALAAKYDVPMVVHMEGYPNLVADFSRLISENPDTTYVWVHNCGRSASDVIRQMLRQHPNLNCDLANMTNVGPKTQSYGTGWPRSEPFTALIETGYGHLFPDMKKLFEDFPDRFTLGMDVAHAQGMNMKNYSRRVERFRELLAQLKPETARKFAELNAIQIFRMDRMDRKAPASATAGLDVNETAKKLIQEYGDWAAFEAAMKANDALEKSDLNANAFWLRVRDAASQLIGG